MVQVDPERCTPSMRPTDPAVSSFDDHLDRALLDDPAVRDARGRCAEALARITDVDLRLDVEEAFMAYAVATTDVGVRLGVASGRARQGRATERTH